MVRLAQKAFYPGRLPFPLLHVDTTWKFREMIAFRDQFVKENKLDLIVHTNHEGVREGINPFDYGSQQVHRHHEDAGAEGRPEPARLRRRVRRGAARRGKEPRQGTRLFLPRQAAPVGSEEPAARAVEPVQRQGEQGRIDPRLPAVATGRSWTCGSTSTWRTSRSCRCTSPPRGRWSSRDGTLIMVDDERMRLEPGEKPADEGRAVPDARLLPPDRRGREHRHHAAGDHPGNARRAATASGRAG